ncbi:glycosyltransferase [Krasilnikovia cinnamomea]|uniref:glycosyltransferase n=1 Tax=Krasilnikovia cinnamomea TaxID=349313 RepID=UPI001A931EA7|nr:glycosyltransferase [Krasilnikovia cinnamomea]
MSIVIPCHTERNWDTLVGSVASALGQRPVTPAEVVVVVDHNPALFERAQRELTGVTVLENRFEQGASGTRNTGSWHTTTPLIAFLDSDIAADPDWLTQLTDPFTDPEVVGTGGAIAAAWDRSRPSWLPDELLWAVGASYTGMPTSTAPIRNVWSASMAVRRDVFTSVGGFRDGFGKVGSRNRPEDTDLCLRMSEAGGHWMYVPGAVVEHHVPLERSTFRFLMRRCYAEGRGKVQMARLLHGSRTLGAERSYLSRTLPRAVLREASGALRAAGPRRAQHASRAGTVVAAVAAAAVGGAVETLGAARRRTPETAVMAAAGS